MRTHGKALIVALAAFLCGCASVTPQPTPVPSMPPTLAIASPTGPSRPPPTATPMPRPTARQAVPPTIKPPLTLVPFPRQTAEPTLGIPPLSGTLYVQRNREILAIDLATFAEQPLGLYADTFHVSPDGAWIAFVVSDTLMIASADGQNSRQFATGANDDFSWAPDSQALAFVRAPESTQWDCPPEAEVWVIELPSSELRRIDAGCNPAWSPDGLRLAYVSSYDLYEQARGGAPPNALYLTNRYGQNRWSPLQAGGGFDLPSGNDYFYRRSLYHPFWSLDGNHVFVVACVQSEGVLAKVETLEMVDSYQGIAQTVGVLYSFGRVEPSPDHQHIAYAGSGEAGFGILGIAILLGEEHPCEQSEWCADASLRLRTTRQATALYVGETDWSPDSHLLAGLYCPQEMTSRCYHESGIAEVRLIDPQTGDVSEPIGNEIDLYGGIEWKP